MLYLKHAIEIHRLETILQTYLLLLILIPHFTHILNPSFNPTLMILRNTIINHSQERHHSKLPKKLINPINRSLLNLNQPISWVELFYPITIQKHQQNNTYMQLIKRIQLVRDL